METENKDKIVEHLKQTLLSHIASNERVSVWLRKIFRYLVVLIIAAASSVLMGIVVIIYILKQPESETEKALEHLREINKQMEVQRKFIQDDRQDAAAARLQNLSTTVHLDSMNHRLDSLLDEVYKRTKR